MDEIIEGCRKDSFIYVNGGYTYRKDKDVEDIRYLRCIKFRVGCLTEPNFFGHDFNHKITRKS